MVRKFALKFTLYFCGFWSVLLLLYVAASGPVLHHVAVKKKNATLTPWQFRAQSFSHLYSPAAPSSVAGSGPFAGIPTVPAYQALSPSSPEDLYTPLFDVVETTPLQAPLNKYLQWWGVNSMRVCGNAMMIFPR